MKISLPSTTFCRKFSNCILFIDFRRSASCVLEEVDDLARWLSRVPQDIDLFYDNLAGKYGVKLDVVRTDYKEVVGTLFQNGLISVSDTNGEDESPGKKNFGRDLRPENVGNTERYIDELFSKYGLCQELHLDLTSACSERCVHCYLPEYPNKYLPYELVEKALREFREHQGLTVQLTGGECMLHPDFARICRLCNALNLNLIVMSNMTQCDEGMIALLKEVDPQFVNVSLYSMDESVHDKVTTIKGSWRKTMSAILACEKAGVHIRLATPLLKENRDSFRALKEFATHHHMHLVPDYNIVPQSNHNCMNMEHACSACELRATLLANREIFDCHWSESPLRKIDEKVCDIGCGRLYLNSLGKYYPCAAMHDYVIGDVQTNTFEEVWRGSELDKLRELKVRDMEGCSDCRNRMFCKVCPAYNFNATGDVRKTTVAKCAVADTVAGVYGKGSELC